MNLEKVFEESYLKEINDKKISKVYWWLDSQISARQPSLTSESLHPSSGILNVTDCVSQDKRYQYILRVGQV